MIVSLDDIKSMRLKSDRISSLKRLARELQFSAAIDELEVRDLIRGGEHVGENAFAATLHYASWAAIARKMAQWLPGVVQPVRSGVIWTCGGGGPHGWVISKQPINPEKPEEGTFLDAVVRARMSMLKTGYSGPVPWTVGGVGKRLLKYIGPKEAILLSTERLISNDFYQYHRCIPGQYDNAALWDCSGYHFHLLKRLFENKKTLRLVVGKNDLHFQPEVVPGEHERFGEILLAVADNKSLRNALVGCMQGSFGKMVGYTRNGASEGRARKIDMFGRGGVRRAAGLLIVRTGYELTQKEALTSSAVYAMIDSVMLTTDQAPTIWAGYGLPHDIRHKGQADVRGLASYKIGAEVKQKYRQGFLTELHAPGDTLPTILYHQKWL